MHDTTFEQITENLKRALDIVENCGEAYKNASDTIKKLMNQAIFEKFYISNDADMEFKVDAEFKPPFDQILEPVKDDIIRINRLAQDCSSKLSYYIDIAKDHIQKIGYIKVDGVSSVFCFIWGWEEPAWGLPFQFHGVFFVMISMKGP